MKHLLKRFLRIFLPVKWEYLEASPNSYDYNTSYIMNRNGEIGWELIAVTQDMDSRRPTFYFKRRK